MNRITLHALGTGVSTCLAFGALVHGLPAMAQTAASQVTPDSVRPEAVQDQGKVVLPETHSTAAPAGAENLSVRVGRINVEGADPQFAARIAAITDSLAGRTMRVSDLYAAAARIEAIYARSGHVLTRATIPPQEIRDGATVHIRIVDGFIEAVDASAVPATVRKAVEARAAALVGQTGLTMAQIERRLLLAGRVPGVTLQSTLVPGKKVGGAVLVLKADWKPVNVTVGADNRLSDVYDNWNFDTQVVLNSVLGMGEQIYGLASTTSDFDMFSGHPERRILGGGAIVPLGRDGLSVNPEFIHADTNPKPVTGGVATRGKLDHAALRLSYPLVLTRAQSLNVNASFDLLDESQSLPGFGVEFSKDKLRYASLGLDWAKAMPAGVVVSAGASITQGIDGLGARNQGDALASGVLLSRIGSKPDFTRIDANATFRAPMGKALRLAAMVRAQASLSGALPASQQFSLDNPDGLSGFALGSINADSGLTARAELSLPVHARIAFAEPYLFGAAGIGHISQPSVLERANIDGWSAGGGLRAQLAGHVSLDAELARTHTNIFADDDTRATVRVSFHF